jgi:hypothetical protein
MKYLVDDFIISSIGRISKYELVKLQSNIKNEIIYLDNRDVDYEEIYLVSVASINSSRIKYITIYKSLNSEIAIISCNNNHIGFGFDHVFIIIDLRTNQTKLKKILSGLFILAKFSKSNLLILSELDITFIDNRFNEMLYQICDFINDYRLTDVFLEYSTDLGTNRINL